MNWNTYFDLTKAERGALTEDQVRVYCNAALMEAGVVQPTEPILVDETPPEVPKARRFVPKRSGRYSTPESFGLAFKTNEDAEAFIDLVARAEVVENDWEAGIDYLRPIDGLISEQVSMVTAANHVKHKAELEQAKSAKAANTKARDEYAKALRVVTDNTEGIWSDYRECVEWSASLAEVRTTFLEYCKITGDNEAAALEFLLKAYDRERIDAALEKDFVENLLHPAVEEESA
jgi:hypothetical protein